MTVSPFPGHRATSLPASPASTGLFDPPAGSAYQLDAVPLGAPRLTSWRERLVQWRELRDVPLYREDARIRAGRGAEQQARGRVSSHHAMQGGHLFGNKRIPRDPRAAAMGRLEADLIAITPRRVVLLEVKNWSGELRVAADHWLQIQRSGHEIRHPDLLLHNRDKLRALHRYLQHQGIDIEPQRFHQAVVFTNQKLAIDPALVDHPGVLQMHDAWAVMGEPTSRSRRVAAAMLNRLLKAEDSAVAAQSGLQMIPPTQLRAAADAIDALRTWDRLTMRGGRTLLGDIIWLRLFGIHQTPTMLNSGGAAELQWRRGLLGGIAWVFGNGSAGQMRGTLYKDHAMLRGARFPLTTDDCVYFNEAGQPRPQIIRLSHVERLQVG